MMRAAALCSLMRAQSLGAKRTLASRTHSHGVCVSESRATESNVRCRRYVYNAQLGFAMLVLDYSIVFEQTLPPVGGVPGIRYKDAMATWTMAIPSSPAPVCAPSPPPNTAACSAHLVPSPSGAPPLTLQVMVGGVEKRLAVYAGEDASAAAVVLGAPSRVVMRLDLTALPLTYEFVLRMPPGALLAGASAESYNAMKASRRPAYVAVVGGFNATALGPPCVPVVDPATNATLSYSLMSQTHYLSVNSS